MIKSKNVVIKSGIKHARSENYNYAFRMDNGFFVRWGKTLRDDPVVAPAPEILDIEVTTICKGKCAFCYKSNTLSGKNMSLDTFKTILDKFPTNLTQIAFGADSTMLSNPDLFAMAEYARENNVIPNITAANITKETAERAARTFGAVAISRYRNKDKCYNSVKRLIDAGLKQVNIHLMISKETYGWALETLKDVKSDKRLVGLNALVFLSLKKKGRGSNHNSLSQEEFNVIVNRATDLGAPIGFDSCSAPKYLESIKDHREYKKLSQFVEPCEAGCFSSYIDVNSNFFPCSFAEGTADWKEGINVLGLDSISDLWKHPRVEGFREKLLANNRNCPIYKV
jgi:MoaA/NifB/PqqE/SkfB family radical SAM enzyme